MEQLIRKITIGGIDQLQLFGSGDENLRYIEKQYDTKIVARGNEILCIGDANEVTELERIFSEMISMLERNNEIALSDVKTIVDVIKTGVADRGEKNNKIDSNSVILYTKSGAIAPKTDGQRKYYVSTRNNDVVFAIGPAGTGKTYLAVAIALTYLRNKLVNKIVLARPAVEAGESLGFLPGDLREKIDPYLKPIYDALFDMVIPNKLKKYMEAEIIEVVPLAYMRGRTLNNAFVILDEAQNTYPNQMKMFLTRLGVNSKAIITGDITQIDLPEKGTSGLVQIKDILIGIEGIDFIYLTEKDVVRHRLVKEIIKAYDKFNEKE